MATADNADGSRGIERILASLYETKISEEDYVGYFLQAESRSPPH